MPFLCLWLWGHPPGLGLPTLYGPYQEPHGYRWNLSQSIGGTYKGVGNGLRKGIHLASISE